MDCKDRLETYLREKRVPFEVRHHPRAVTAQEVAASEHVPGKMLAKTVMVLADGEMVMLALPAPYQVDIEKASTALGVGEVRLAREEEFEGAFPDCELGATPPFGNLYDLPVYVKEHWRKTKRSASRRAFTPTTWAARMPTLRSLANGH